MKHNYLKHLFTALLLLCTTVASAVTYTDWKSTNKTDGSTSSKTYTIQAESGSLLSFNWEVSSESNYDKLIITINGVEVLNKSGEESGSYQYTFNTSGTQTIVVKYTKDSSYSSGGDYGRIYSVRVEAPITGSCGENLIWSYVGGTLTITGTGEIKSGGWDDLINSVTKIIIENGATSIGWAAFRDFVNLKSISIPASVLDIKEAAFVRCTSLEELNILDGENSLRLSYGDWEAEWGLFYQSPLKTVYIGRSLSISNDYESLCPFYDKSLQSLTIGKGVTYLDQGTFYLCSVKNLYIRDLTAWCKIDFRGNDLMRRAEKVYINNRVVSTLYIPADMTVITNNAIHGAKFSSITVDSNNPVYDSREGCNAIIEKETSTLIVACNNSTIPNGVTSIGDYAFFGCNGLTGIEVPNSVTKIGYAAFYGCTQLASISLPDNVTCIGGSAFNGTAWYENQPEGLVYIGKYLCGYKSTYGYMPDDTRIVINEGTKCIADYAFYECEGLVSVIMPNSVTNIGDYAFAYCYYLNNAVIGNSVTSIGDYAFIDCNDLTSITIPNSVTSIGKYAFAWCDALTSIKSYIPAEKLFTPESDAFNSLYYRCTLYVPYGAKETYASTAGWNDFKNIVEIPGVAITINQYGCATYCSEYALDFSNVEGLKAYAATGYNKATQVVTLTRVQTAEAGVGLFLKGEPGEYIVPVIEYSNDYSLNMLVGTLEQTTVNSTDGAMSNYKFTVAELDEAPMFYPFEDNTTFSAGKAYLQIPTAWLPATVQKSLSVRFDEGETTDIDELKGETREVKIIYDLQGRVVENPTSGIYIINGKKVVVK